MARTGLDNFTSVCPSLVTAGTIVADRPLADVILARWIECTLMAFKKGIIRYTIHHVFSLVYDMEILQQALTACHISWNVDKTHPELTQMSKGSTGWRMEKDGEELVCNVPETAAAMAKALVAVRFPHFVEPKEVSAFLDTEDGYTQDVFLQLCGAGVSLACA